jgi:hypothetical protein
MKRKRLANLYDRNIPKIHVALPQWGMRFDSIIGLMVYSFTMECIFVYHDVAKASACRGIRAYGIIDRMFYYLKERFDG